MCGLGVILRVTPPGDRADPIPEPWIDELDRAVAWRGPDGNGRFLDSAVRPDGSTVQVAMVHRRLSIIDHAGGAQPMLSNAGDNLVAVAFNGCIYNHHTLRDELTRAGATFISDHADTEVLLHACRQQLSGKDPSAGAPRTSSRAEAMMAAAIWDRRRAALFLITDRFAEKPLFTWTAPALGLAACASTADAIRRLRRLVEGRDCRPDPSQLADWMAMGFSMSPPDPSVTQARTPLAELRPDAAPAQAPVTPAVPRREHPLTLDELDTLLDLAVARRLDADVPLGCFLSGGIDSSLIAHYARHHFARLTTLCVRMPDPRYDESPHAARVAAHLGTDHLTLDVQPTAADDLQHLIRLIGLPLADSSLLPAYWLCRAARTHVKAALSGDAGDELFCGYDRYRAARWLPWLRPVAWAVPVQQRIERDPTTLGARAARLIRAARGLGYTDLLAVFPSELRRRIFRAPAIQCNLPRFSGREQARRFDLDHYLPADLLRKLDTASMAAGIEVRCPFLDHNLVDAALDTPISTLMRGNRPKAMLRELAARHLPPEIVTRPKQGFAIPISEWFRTGFGGLRALLMDTLSSQQPFGLAADVLGISIPAVREMVAEHMESRRDHGQRLYALLVLSIWARE